MKNKYGGEDLVHEVHDVYVGSYSEALAQEELNRKDKIKAEKTSKKLEATSDFKIPGLFELSHSPLGLRMLKKGAEDKWLGFTRKTQTYALARLACQKYSRDLKASGEKPSRIVFTESEIRQYLGDPANCTSTARTDKIGKRWLEGLKEDFNKKIVDTLTQLTNDELLTKEQNGKATLTFIVP